MRPAIMKEDSRDFSQPIREWLKINPDRFLPQPFHFTEIQRYILSCWENPFINIVT
jgi:hypothetical protein